MSRLKLLALNRYQTIARTAALKQLNDLQPAPSVGMHDVPRESVGQHLGFGKDEEEGRDALDESVAREYRSVIFLRCHHADAHQNTHDLCITCKKRTCPQMTQTPTPTDGIRTTRWVLRRGAGDSPGRARSA